MTDLRVAVAQMNSTRDLSENLRTLTVLATEAAANGADFVAFPENATLLAPERERIAAAETLEGRQVSTCCELAARLGCWILVGSVVEVSPEPLRTYNTSVLIARDGTVAGVYRKIHLFDVSVAGQPPFVESASVVPGPIAPVVVAVEGFNLGLSICYDLRFPELYRALVASGADALAVPAAFTLRTGMAHWHALLRARAIENLSYVIAPAQVGRHYGERESFGHSLVAGPWGDVVAEVESGGRLGYATLHRAAIDAARAAIPCLSHRRM